MPSEEDAELAAIRARLMRDMMATADEAEPEGEDDGPDWPDAPLTVTDADFQQRIGEFPLALVDFWAAWCGPCRMIAPSLDEIAREMKGQVVVLKLNVDENPRTSQTYGIQSLPTIGVFKNGRPVDAVMGAVPKPHIVAAVRKHIGGARRGTPGPRRV